MECESRVVVLIDMDCFYCQVEEKLNPELKGKPIAVVQYNPWKGGGIIAVNYVARAMGVTRHMRGDEAKEKCPEIQLPSVPCSRGKADITKYRDAGKDVATVLQKFTPLLERASIDEAYLDITEPVHERLKTLNVNSITNDLLPNTYALGYDSVDEFLSDVHSCGSDSIEFDYDHARRLLVGAVVVSEIRAAVYEETGYRCSAGIAHNKILAKLVCGMNKPNKQTVLPTHSINILYKTLPLKKVKHLGGKFGYTVCEILKISTMGELQGFSEKELQNKFDDKNGTWLYNIARGIDLEPVQARFNPKSIGCCKQFRGKAALLHLESVRKWLKDLGDEIDDRLEKDALENNRTPKQMVVSYSTQVANGRDTSSSRSYNFVTEDDLCGDFFSNKALELLMENLEGVKIKDGEPNRKIKAPVTFLGISVGKFEDHVDSKKVKNITDYFSAGTSKPIPERKSTEKSKEGDKKTSKDNGKEYILQKFFQVTDKNKDKTSETKINNEQTDSNQVKNIESPLDKQESFFAKMLNKKIDFDARSVESDASLQSMSKKLEQAKPTTPICEVVNCGDNSNDTDYSGSTINNEINKSIALFEEEPNDTVRINNMRKLLNSTIIDHNLKKSEPDKHNEEQENVTVPVEKTEIETYTCPECNKKITMDMVEQHSDYHFALKLREEERQQVRQERNRKVTNNPPSQSSKKEKDKKKKVEELSTVDKTKSITNFLVKICDKTVTESCTECGKKIPVDKLSDHMDFHEAQKLNRELNHRHNLVQSSSSVKRKRASSSPTKKQKMPKCKSIDSFFKVS